MATSGSWTYNATAANIITSAAEDINLIANGQSVDSNDVATMLRTLNFIAKQWQGTSDKFPGLKIWTRQRLFLPFVKNQNIYSIGPAGTDDRASTAYVVTQLTAAKLANATSISIFSGTGITNADQIGILLSDGTLGWTTVSAGGGTTTITLPANTLGAANSNATVYTYTSKAQRFPDIETALLRDDSAAGQTVVQPIDIPIAIYTDVRQYEAITQKNAPGDPTAILVEPGRLSTKIRTNFDPQNLYKNLRLTVIYPSEDYVDSTGADDISYPQEYYAALEWELAMRSAPKFGKEWTKAMEAAYQKCVAEGVNLNPMNTSQYFEPGRDIFDAGSPFTRP